MMIPQSKTLTWEAVVGAEKKKPYFQEIMGFLSQERQLGKTIYPQPSDCFNALRWTSFESIKVVLLGQDPYHGPGQAHGLCFSVQPGIPSPPSLQNMFKELRTDLGIAPPNHGNLAHWARQGVLLLNTVLTVERGRPQSHAKIGWQTFTDAVIEAINQHHEHVVFLLWGANAQRKATMIDASRHHVLQAPHPSPLSAHRGFLGCKHFSKTNQWLETHNLAPIDWALPELERT